jgi:hypothetical protein
MTARIIADAHAGGRPWPRKNNAHVPHALAASATSAVPAACRFTRARF